MTIGISTGCAYCRIRITPMTATTVSATLLIAVGLTTSSVCAAVESAESVGSGCSGVWLAQPARFVGVGWRLRSSVLRGCRAGRSRVDCTSCTSRRRNVGLPWYRRPPCWSPTSTSIFPSDLIAQEAAPRGTSRLLVLDRRAGRVEHARVARAGAVPASGRPAGRERHARVRRAADRAAGAERRRGRVPAAVAAGGRSGRGGRMRRADASGPEAQARRARAIRAARPAR